MALKYFLGYKLLLLNSLKAYVAASKPMRLQMRSPRFPGLSSSGRQTAGGIGRFLVLFLVSALAASSLAVPLPDSCLLPLKIPALRKVLPSLPFFTTSFVEHHSADRSVQSLRPDWGVGASSQLDSDGLQLQLSIY